MFPRANHAAVDRTGISSPDSASLALRRRSVPTGLGLLGFASPSAALQAIRHPGVALLDEAHGSVGSEWHERTQISHCPCHSDAVVESRHGSTPSQQLSQRRRRRWGPLPVIWILDL